ncbi:MAG: replication-associated recombination protein A [Nitrospirales bacterium]|nr:replication-associated recombination protein A [Nitrospira sp.]MDR4501555.1 replication-associated recombination protein A [Nitrospirales bacterium]
MNEAEQSELFPVQGDKPAVLAPLADRMRPRNFSDFVGQEGILGHGTPLRRAIENQTLPSLILWGPPGSGKTTLAGLIAQKVRGTFVPFSAVLSGVPELRTILKVAAQRRKASGTQTILFVDEIHRFNKAQQDAFLPHVERGDVTLIGATTQNPSFEVIAPLLSRSLIVPLQQLDADAMGQILDRALTDTKDGLGALQISLTPNARDLLIRYGNGDARSMLTALDFVVSQAQPSTSAPLVIELEAVEAGLQKKALRYDRDGEEHYNLISAYIKSLRDSDPDGALYWLARMLEGGEDPKFIARRMVIFASEDVGNANPEALLIATSVFKAAEVIGPPEVHINLAHGTTYLASSAKSNASYVGLQEAMHDAKEFGNLPVPMHLRNAVTSLMKGMGYGKGYRYAHDDSKAKDEQEHLPKELKDRTYYRPRAPLSPHQDSDEEDPTAS